MFPKGANAYTLLGIDSNASETDIVQAYRRAAMRAHPDRNPDDPQATKNFQAIQAAYRHLLTTHKTLPSLADLDDLVAAAEAADPTAPAAATEAAHDFRDDIPYRSLCFFVGGLVCFFYFSFIAALLLFSLALFLTTSVYHPPQSLLGKKIERYYKHAVQIYFTALLIIGILYLLSQISLTNFF